MSKHVLVSSSSRRPLALATLLLWGANAVGLAPQSFAAPELRDQTPALFISKKGYSLRPPAGLRRNRAGMTLVPLDVLFGQRGAACFNVSALPRNVKRNRSLDEIRAANIQFMSRAMDNFKLRGQGRMTIDGLPAVTLTSTFTLGTPSVPLRVLNVFVVRGNMLYTFAGVCPVNQMARYAPLFQKTLVSVRWTK